MTEATDVSGEFIYRLTYPDLTYSEVRADYAGVVTAAQGGTALYLHAPPGKHTSIVVASIPAGVLVVRLTQLCIREQSWWSRLRLLFKRQQLGHLERKPAS